MSGFVCVLSSDTIKKQHFKYFVRRRIMVKTVFKKICLYPFAVTFMNILFVTVIAVAVNVKIFGYVNPLRNYV